MKTKVTTWMTLAGGLWLTFFATVPSIQAAGSGGSFAIKGEALLHFEQAMTLRRKGDVASALDHYMRAHKANPDVLAHDDEGLLDDALRLLSAKAATGSAPVHRTFQLCEVYALKGFEAESMACYRKVVKEDTDSPFGKLAREKLERLRATRMAHEAAMARQRVLDAALAAKRAERVRKPTEEEKLARLLAKSAEGHEKEVEALRGKIDMLGKRLQTLEKAKREVESKFAAYRKKAEVWRRYQTLFFANPQNVRDLRNNRFNRAVFPPPSAYGAQAPRPNTTSR